MKTLRTCAMVVFSSFVTSCICSCGSMSGFNADMVLPDKYQDPNWVLVENSP